MTVCETLAMCKNAYIDEKNGECSLALDKDSAEFKKVIEACPGPKKRAFSADMVNGQWRLSCSGN